jgi:hypothetical protein
LYDEWKQHFEFVTVYVREAHPIDDEAATPTNARAGILIRQPATLEERREVAQRCTAALQLKTPLVVDEIDNRVAEAYSATPDRLYVVGRDGRIAYRGGPGPFGFNPIEMEQTMLLMLLEQEEATRRNE